MRTQTPAISLAAALLALASQPSQATHADVKQMKSIAICSVMTDGGAQPNGNSPAAPDPIDHQAFVNNAYDQISKALTDGGLKVVDPGLLNKALEDQAAAKSQADAQARVAADNAHSTTTMPTDAEMDARLAALPPAMRDQVKAQMKAQMAASTQAAAAGQAYATSNELAQQHAREMDMPDRNGSSSGVIVASQNSVMSARRCGIINAPVNPLSEKLGPTLVYKDFKYGGKDNTDEAKKRTQDFLDAVASTGADGFAVMRVTGYMNPDGYAQSALSASFYDKAGNNLWNYQTDSTTGLFSGSVLKGEFTHSVLTKSLVSNTVPPDEARKKVGDAWQKTFDAFVSSTLK